MARALWVCALVCLFAVTARATVDIPWPPATLPDCSAPWLSFGSYEFCHMTLSGTQTSNLIDSETVSSQIEPCNWHFFRLDANSYPGGLVVGDWLEATFSLDNTLGNVNTSTVSLLYLFSDDGVLPDVDNMLAAQIAIEDLVDQTVSTFVLSPCPLSTYSVLWLAVGDFGTDYPVTSDPGSYSLTVDRFRNSRYCGNCICEPGLGLTEIPLTAGSLPVVLNGSAGWFYDDRRPAIDESASSLYPRYRNFHFNVPAGSYAPGAFLYVNVSNFNSTLGGNINVYLSQGPYAVDSSISECFYASVSPSNGGQCPDGTFIGTGNSGIYVPPCDFYYGDYYLTVEFSDENCTADADYLIIVTVMAPQITNLAISSSPSVAGPVPNNLQTNILFGANAGYSQYDHYQLTVAGITERSHAFVRLSSVVEISSYESRTGSIWDLQLAMRAGIAGPAPAYGSRDRVLVPAVIDSDSCADDCYSIDYVCSTDGQCGCGFYVRSCDLDATTYYLSVVPDSPQDDDDDIIDGQSYHLLVRVDEDTLPLTLAPGQPIVATLPVWSPYQVYVLAAPNSANTWAVVELFTPSNQNALVLDMKQGSALNPPTTFTTDCATTTTVTGTFTNVGRSFDEKCNKEEKSAKSFVAPGNEEISCGAAEPDQRCTTGNQYACYLMVDTCKMQNGLIYLTVYPDESVNPTNFYGSWEYTIWGDIESPWALQSDVTYTDRVRLGQYNHYYIDVDEEAAQAGSWLSVDFENIDATCEAGFTFASYLNYDALAGDCPCYKFVDVCSLPLYSPSDCGSDDDCSAVNDWTADNGFNMPDNTYPFYYDGDLFDATDNRAACRVQATACAFRPGRWYASVTLQPAEETKREAEPLFGTSSNGGAIAGFTMTARIHAAPEVAELSFDELHTDVLQPSQIQHFQLTNVDAQGEDLVLTVSWYEEALGRFNLFTGNNPQDYASLTLPKAWLAGWGIELRVNFGELALEECYGHPWSCTASIETGASCQVIIPACRFAAVDPRQVFVSVRYSRPIRGSESYDYLFANEEFADVSVDLPDALLPQMWVGEAQYNLLVTGEATTVIGLPINTAVYGAVKKDRYAHYSFNLASTSLLRTDIDIYYHAQSTMSGEAPVLALSQNNLAFGARGCRDCFTSLRSCQTTESCHWSYDSCNGLSAGTTYYLSVYNPPVAFFDQALEYALQVSQQPLLNTVTLGAGGRVQLDIALQEDEPTRVFFQVEFDAPAIVSPWDGLYTFVYVNGGAELVRDTSRENPTYYWQHDELAGRCDCFSFYCADELDTDDNCPIDSSDRTTIFDQVLTASAYFLTLEFPAGWTDSVQVTVQSELISYAVNRRTPTANRGSGGVFTLGSSTLRFGEDITADYNDGDNMDNWLTTTGGAIDWDETNNVLRNQQAIGVYLTWDYGFPAPSRYASISQRAIFYYLQVTNPSAVDGYPMPNRVYAGIDNVRTNYDNCRATPTLTLDYVGTREQALSAVLDTVRTDERACSDSASEYYPYTNIMETSNGVAFGELPACIFTHAGTTEYIFYVEVLDETAFFDVELADSGYTSNPVVATVIWDVRFFLQQPIAVRPITDFWVSPSFTTETVGFPYTTNWQPFVGDQTWSDDDDEFVQRFELNLGQLTGVRNFAQVVIELEEPSTSLSITIGGQYAPNRPVDSDHCFGGCHLRSRLEQRQSTLSALQLNVGQSIVDGDNRLGNASGEVLNFANPNSDLVYTCDYPSCVFTLDPCALSQTSLWYFDMWGNSDNVSFIVYHTPVVDVSSLSVTEITAQDINDRDFVPDLASPPADLDGLDDYEFFFIDIADLNLDLGSVRSRLEIQVFWEDDFNTGLYSPPTAAIFITKEQPLFLQAGAGAGFPFQASWPAAPYNYAVRSDYTGGEFAQQQLSQSFIEQCFDGHYASFYQGNLSTPEASSAVDERFFIDGCDLQGVSQLWVTARMMTPGDKQFRLLTRVVRDKIVLNNAPINNGYSNTAPSFSVDSDALTAIEPRSFNHHSFALPGDLQSGAARSINFELRFDDAQSYRYDNGTAAFTVLISADSPAGWNDYSGPYNYDSPSCSPGYCGLFTFGEMATTPSLFPAATTADCFSNLADYQPPQVSFTEAGYIPLSGWDEFYYVRGAVDLAPLRFASQLWVSVYFDSDFDVFPAFEFGEWQGYTLTVWTQAEPSTTVTPILQNVSTNDLCHTLTVDTGIDAVTIDNITWINALDRPPTPTWFTFTLDNSLVPLDCSGLQADSRCMFTQYLRFELFNDDFFTPLSTESVGPVLGYNALYGVYGPGRVSIGGAGTMFTNNLANDAFGGRWAIHDSLWNSNSFNIDVVANASSHVFDEFYPCVGQYRPDSEWEPANVYTEDASTQTLRPGTYYIPVWTFDSIDFTVCASLEQIPYDTLWTNPVTPYVPDELDDDVVVTLAQDEVTVNADDGAYLYYWFHLANSQFTERDYLQVWFDRVAVCDEISNCENITDFSTSGSPDDAVLQMFRSDCQLWTCQRDGDGNGCMGRYSNGYALPPFEFLFEDTNRYVLGGAGLSPGSLASGDYFIKLLVPNRTRYTLSVYLRTPPATVALPSAVAVRSTIFATAYQHYSYTVADTASSVLATITAQLTDVRCGVLEMFAKHGTVAGPFDPSALASTTFIGSNMYDDPSFSGEVANPSTLDKTASASCSTALGDNCTIVIGTTGLFKNLDANGVGTTTWFFTVFGVSNAFDDNNDQLEDVYDELPVTTDDFGIGFLEPTTFFLTATPEFYDVSAGQIGCPLAVASVSPLDCSGAPALPEPNAQVTAYGFHTLTRFTTAFVVGESNVNATVSDSANTPYSEPIGVCSSWGLVAGQVTTYSPDEACFSSQHSGPSNVYQSSSSSPGVQADFVHEPVSLLSPGLVYSGYSRYPDSHSLALLNSQWVFYEFSPALRSLPSFSLSIFGNSECEVANSLDPEFGFDSCDQINWDTLSPADFIELPCDNYPRFLRLDISDSACFGVDSCLGESPCVPISWQLSYTESLPTTVLELGVNSCGASWTPFPITEELTGFSGDFQSWVLHELPVVTSTSTQANWLVLDFFPSFEDYSDDDGVFFFGTQLCEGVEPIDDDGELETEFDYKYLVCPQWSYMLSKFDVNDDTYNEYTDEQPSDASITPSVFSVPVSAAGSVSSASPQLSITVQSTDLTFFDLGSGFAVFAIDVTIADDEIPRSVLSFSLNDEQSVGPFDDDCNDFDWWINFGTPVPYGCADLSSPFSECEVQSGTYFVGVRSDMMQDGTPEDYYALEWSATLTVSLTTHPVVSLVPGVPSALTTLQPGQSLAMQITSDGSMPEAYGQYNMRFTSLTGTSFSELPQDSLPCGDCEERVSWQSVTNVFDVPITFSVQAEPVSALLMNMLEDSLTDAVFQLWSSAPYADYLETPYIQQRAAVITPFALGSTVSASLYNFATYRQVQVYSVQRATPGALAQFRLANVLGGVLQLTVSGQYQPFDNCELYKSCLTLQPFSDASPDDLDNFYDNNFDLFEFPLNNWGGSCALVLDACDWAASPSWYAVVRDQPIQDGSAPDSEFLYVPTQNNPFVPATFDLIITEEQWAPLSSAASAVQTFTAQPAPSTRSADNPRGNAQHFFYAFETESVSSVRIVVDVTAAGALATSGVWVTVTDSDCGCESFQRNVWCGADYPGWLCEIEIAVHAEHPGTTTFYVDVYGLKGSFSLSAHSGLDNCVYSDGQSFCPSLVLNYPYWPSLDASDLDAKASCLYDELIDLYRNVDENGCPLCVDEIDDACQLALRAYACAATFNSCDASGFLDAHICVDTCTAVEQACPYTFAQIGLPNLDCRHPRYNSDVCF